ncbi:transmembrane protein 54-like isoform X1 [Sinocyclocheilus anshuiensis]|uniref:transmembrane protein 54-like isoform X1 n=1 Tax=Sinocyclocheilus anshuiensis TaxID=1608454 RepID=UPI0007B91DEB|nr:PREDICTED: transmembrane protein 54-like isoform X1 [Sinocyclocheilus anshuiensis]
MHAGEREGGRRPERHGLCCGSLKDDKILMKMGLGLVLVGHVNFLLGALVHGVVLRHIKVFTWNKKLVYPISNVIALVAGLMAIIGGISAIVLSKNKKNQLLSWFLLIVSVLAVLLGAASAVGITVATVRAIMWEGHTLFAHCDLPANMTYYSITNECPFDPTRIYGTTLILWFPLILMSVVEVVFSCRCFLACTSFLRLHCPWRRNVRVRVQLPEETALPPGDDPNEEEATEQNDLLDKDTVAVETSDWL